MTTTGFSNLKNHRRAYTPVLFKLKTWATFRTGYHTNNNNNSNIYMKITEIWADIITYFWNMKVLDLHKNQLNPRNSEHSVASFSIMKMCRGSWRQRVMLGEVMCFDEVEISNTSRPTNEMFSDTGVTLWGDIFQFPFSPPQRYNRYCTLCQL